MRTTGSGSQPRSVSDGSTATTLNKREDFPFQQVAHGDSPHGKTLSYSIPWLPEDVWCHIHSLMPMRAAARAACLSRSFLRSWRSRPNLTLNLETLGLIALGKVIDRILRNHLGGLKTLYLDLDDTYGTFPYVDSWLQLAVTPGIEELILVLHKKYKFPCSLLSGAGNTIRGLQLDTCVFRPTSELGPLRRLTNVELSLVRVTGVELECLLSKSLALEQLVLLECKEVIFLKIPCVLQLLSRLTIVGCGRLQMIDCKAPNLSFFSYHGGKIKLSLGQQLQMKKLCMYYLDLDVVDEIPSIMPNLATISIGLNSEVVKTPMLSTKFLCLKHITIKIPRRTTSPSYDYFSLISFFDVSPSLETLFLDVPPRHMEDESVFEGSLHLRQLSEHRHKCLKSVKIVGFSSAKSLVELTCCIVKNAVSLECLTLDTFRDTDIKRCFGKANTVCWPAIRDVVLKEAFEGVAAIRMYIEDKVAPTVKLTVLEPCAECHSSEYTGPKKKLIDEFRSSWMM